MSLRLNDVAPDFTTNTTQGSINFHEWIGGSWAMLLSYPKDFTPVCTTELGYTAKIEPEFTKRNCKIIGLRVDAVESHLKWEKDIEETQGAAISYEGRTAVTNQTVRSVFIISPDKKIKLQLTYPMTTGGNFDEILRLLGSMQLTVAHQVTTSVNWQQREEVIIVTAVSDAEAKVKYTSGWKTIKPCSLPIPQPAIN
jgi:alkyl hydroperoxide reductase subunit AhpC